MDRRRALADADRRRVLACLTGGLTGLAGCNGLGAGGSTPASNRPGETVEVPNTGTFVLRDPGVQEAVYDFETPVPGVRWTPDAQFLVFELERRAEGYFPPPTVRLDGESFPVQRLDRPRVVRFAAAVPVRPVDRAVVDLNGVRWRLPSAVVEQLAQRPRFRLRDARIVSRGEEAGLEVTVANDGDRDGVWRGVANARWVADGGDTIRQPVPAGECRTGTVLRIARPAEEVTVLEAPGPDERGIRYGAESG